MSTRLYTDDELTKLRNMRKHVMNPRARWLEKPRVKPMHRQRIFQVSAREVEGLFSVYQRQNIDDQSDFSCGISYLPPGGSSLTLARYNGPSHWHGNIFYRPHVHRASQKAISEGLKPESEATETDRFRTLAGALSCLIDDFNLCGIKSEADHPELVFHDA